MRQQLSRLVREWLTSAPAPSVRVRLLAWLPAVAVLNERQAAL